IPYSLLQPIVQNAIKHGIVSRIAPGRIEISAGRFDDTLQLRVKDNGPGLLHRESISGRAKEGLGLANTRARLEQMYRAAYRFEIRDAAEGGLQVTLEVPFVTTGAVRA